MTLICETCKQEFEHSQSQAKYCKIRNNGKCKQIGHRARRTLYMQGFRAKRREEVLEVKKQDENPEEEKPIDSYWLHRGNISGAKVLHYISRN